MKEGEEKVTGEREKERNKKMKKKIKNEQAGKSKRGKREVERV